MGAWREHEQSPYEITAQDFMEQQGPAVSIWPGDRVYVSVERVDGGINPWTVNVHGKSGVDGWQMVRQQHVRGDGVNFTVDGMPAFRIGVESAGAPPLAVKVKMQVESRTLPDFTVPSFYPGPTPEEFAEMVAEVEPLT